MEYDKGKNKKLIQSDNFNTAGRNRFDDWTGTLAVLYALHKGVALNFSENVITIASEDADPLCAELVSRFNLRREGKGRLKQLCDTYDDLLFCNDQYEEWYKSFINEDLFRLCSDFESGSTINPPELVCDFVNAIVRNHGCSTVYNPFAGLGRLSRHSCGYTHQEPSSDFSLMGRLLMDISSNGNEFVTGDFNTDWLADGHDAVVCIPPINYMQEKDRYDATEEEDTILNRYRQTLKLLFDKLIVPSESLKLAIIFVNVDFLYADEFERYRKALCELGFLKNVILLPEDTFSDMKAKCAILVFDYANCRDSVVFTEEREFLDFESYPDFLEDAFECFDEGYMSFSVPYSTLAGNHYSLMIDFYLYASKSSQSIYSELGDYDLIPLKSIVTVVQGERKPRADKRTIRADQHDFSFLYNGVRSGASHLENPSLEDEEDCDYNYFLTDFGYDHDRDIAYPPGALILNTYGMLFNESEEEMLFNCGYLWSFAILPDKNKIDPHYLIAALSSDSIGHVAKLETLLCCLRDNSTESFEEDRINYILNWCIPVPKEGITAQREVLDEYFNGMPGESSSPVRSYDVVILGDIETSELLKRSFNVVGEGNLRESSRDSINKVREILSGNHIPDAVVVDYSFGDKGLNEALRCSERANIPLYVLLTHDQKLSEDYLPDDYIEYLKDNRLHRSIVDLINQLRKELDYRNSPEAIVRNEYALEFQAAEAVQEAFSPDFDIAKGMEAILVTTRRQDPAIAERSFNFFRNVRDLVFKELVRVQALPSMENYGAIANFLADKAYKKAYYMTGYLMPNSLAAGLQYLTFVSNEAVHNSNGNKDTALSAVHILFQLLFWTRKMIDEGFFDRQHTNEFFVQAGWHLNEDEYIEGKQYIVKEDKDGYKYAGHIHLADKKVDIHEGDVVVLNAPPSLENQPRIREDMSVYLVSINYTKK